MNDEDSLGKARNEEVLQRAGKGMKLILEIRTKQMRFLGHLMRKDGLENLALTGKIEGRRSRERQWSLWMANLNEWIGERGVKYQEVALFEKARDRELWKSIIAHINVDMAQRERERDWCYILATGGNACVTSQTYTMLYSHHMDLPSAMSPIWQYICHSSHNKWCHLW